MALQVWNKAHVAVTASVAASIPWSGDVFVFLGGSFLRRKDQIGPHPQSWSKFPPKTCLLEPMEDQLERLETR